MTDRFELDVPMLRNKPPLTANQRLHWREKAKRVAMVRSDIHVRARYAKIGEASRLTVQLHYAPGDNRRRDAPNLVATSKPAIDGLVDAGCVPDDTDAYVTELMPVIHPGPGKRRLWLTVDVTR